MAKKLISLSDLTTKYRGAGVWTIISDESVQAIPNSGETVRLVVGFSKVGWYNRPFYIERGDTKTAELLFGKRDKSLERKGSFFHKSLEVALQSGPVLALNLLKFNNSMNENGTIGDLADQAEYQSISTDVAGANGEKRKKLYASYFQKERFYMPKSEYLLATRDDADKNQILSFVNLSQSKLSFVIKKADIKGYDITVREWYAGEEIPSFLRPTDLISDYFVEVITISGDYGSSKYQSLSIDPLLGEYFTKSGLVAEKLEKFLSRNEIVVKNRSVGCLIPDFMGKNGENLFIESAINSNVLSTGVICAIDRNQIEEYEYGTNESFVDLIGHRLVDGVKEEISCLSYKQNLTASRTMTNTERGNVNHIILSDYTTVVYEPKKIIITINSGHTGFEDIKQSLQLGQYVSGVLKNGGVNAIKPVLTISRLNKFNNSIVFELTSPYKNEEKISSDKIVDIDYKITAVEVLAKATVVTPTDEIYTALGISDSTVGLYKAKLQYMKDNSTIMVNSVEVSKDLTSITGKAAKYKAVVDELLEKISDLNGFIINSSGEVISNVGSGNSANGRTLEMVATDNKFNKLCTFSGGVSGVKSIPYEEKSDMFVLDGTNTYFLADKDSEFAKGYKDDSIKSGERIDNGTKQVYFKVSEVEAISDVDSVNDARKLLKISLFSDANLEEPIANGSAPTFVGNKIEVESSSVSISDVKSFVSISEDLKTIVLSSEDGNEITKNGFSYTEGEDEDGNPLLARIISVKNGNLDENGKKSIIIECDNKIRLIAGGKSVRFYKSFTKVVKSLEIFNLNGFSLQKSVFPDGTNAKIREIYSVLTNTNVGKALADPELSNFRYIVDTFNGGLEPKSKAYLCELAMNRQKCLALLNAPSIKEFKASSNPRFTSSPTAENPLPELEIDYIVKGGNTDENPDWLYSLPDEEQGASFAGFFFPNIEVTDTDNSIASVPPSAYVSNAFMKKFGTTDEFKPVAGVMRGLITGTGVTGIDHEMTKDEYGELIEFGINPIINKGGSLTIYGNETAYQRFSSILNNINARDTLITFEIDTENILLPYVWDYNDDTLKSTVSTLLRNYYDGMKNSYGAIEDYELIFSRENNPSWVVANNACIVDVAVTLTSVAKKFINRITLKGRSVNQSGFTTI